MFEQEECRHQTSDDSAQRVQAVEDRDVAPTDVRLPRHAAGDGRQRSPHCHGGHRQHQRAQHESAGSAADQAQAWRPAGGDVQRADQEEQQRAGGRRQRHDGFELRVQPDRTRVAIRTRSQQHAAGAQAADEDRQHRRRCRGGCAEDQAELAKPSELVDEGAEARSEHERRDSPGRSAHVGVSVQILARTAERARAPGHQVCTSTHAGPAHNCFDAGRAPSDL